MPLQPCRHAWKRPVCALLLICPLTVTGTAQVTPWATSPAPAVNADTLPIDRGADGLAQTLAKLRTWGSLMMIVAHPDDEDGGMLAYESRGAGVRTTLMTLTRGEGGQNAMSGDTYDALGLLRTNELLAADRYYGVTQLWGTEADYGFSKTKEEAFAKWGHDRVLRDVVKAIREERPLVLTSVFIGGVTDGHGHHQVAGEITQEAFNAAGDPNIFPDQIAAGLRPWKPLAVFERVPFAPITAKGMYDYATDTWAPPSFTNYLTGAHTTAPPTADVTIPEGQWDPVLGESYLQVARAGWGLQMSQNGGGNPPLSGPDRVGYHRYGSRAPAASGAASTVDADSFFAGIDTGIPGMLLLAHGADTGFVAQGLDRIDRAVTHSYWGYTPAAPDRIVPDLCEGYKATQALLDAVAASALTPQSKADLAHELNIKLVQFNTALVEALGLHLDALTLPVDSGAPSRVELSLYPQQSPTHVVPGETFDVRLHISSANPWSIAASSSLTLAHASLVSQTGQPWQIERRESPGLDRVQSSTADAIFAVTVPMDAAPTAPYFTRPSIEQPYYDLSSESLRGRSHSPYPLVGAVEFRYNDIPLRLSGVVQGDERTLGRGDFREPLVVTPGISVQVADPIAVLPAAAHTVSVTVTATNEEPDTADGSLTLEAPAGWQIEPAAATLHLAPAQAATRVFTVTPPAGASATALHAVAIAGNSRYTSGFVSVGYPGLPASNLYRPAQVNVMPLQVQVAPGTRVAYVMGTGDPVPQALRTLGIPVTLLTADDLARTDLSGYSAVMLGVRAYTADADLAQASGALQAFAQRGGTVVIEYQSNDFPGTPFSLALGSSPAKVVDESSAVSILAPQNPLLTTPNRITAADFNGWVEERGHGFAAAWSPHWTPLLEMADPGQAPQRGGLLVAPWGKGRYVYLALALYRQTPEGVAGAYRLLANLVSPMR